MFASIVTAIGVAIVANVALAVPTTSTPECPKGVKTTSQNANFDDLKGVPGVARNPIPQPYKGVYYQGFTFSDVIQTNLAPGLLPHSPTNFASTSLVPQTLQGTPMLTTNYQNAPVSSISLKSFYYGCVVSLQNAAAAVPSDCNLAITGYKGSDNSVSNAKQICAQQFQFHPTGLLSQQAFSGAVSPACADADFYILQYSPNGGAAATATDIALVLDDIKYDLKTCL